MNAKQKEMVCEAGFAPTDFHKVHMGEWSHDGFVAWQLELCDESKGVVTEDSRIAAVLRQLDDLE